jgi:signal peptidase I
VFRLAVVDGDSMNNTLHNQETLIISNFMYEPENNDIIVFTSPSYKNPLVKRVIAVGGQTVDIDFENWKVTVDGKVLQEDYVNYLPYAEMDSFDVSFPLTVPEGYVFVMGDNRNNSSDSRSSKVGFVDERYILGKVELRLLPFNKFGTVD